MTKKVYQAGMGGKDEEAKMSGKEIKEPLAAVPIKAWSEGPCESTILEVPSGDKWTNQ